MTPPERELDSRRRLSTPSFLRVHAQDRPLIPAPMMMTSGIIENRKEPQGAPAAQEKPSAFAVSCQVAFDDLGERSDKRRIAVQCRNAAEVVDARLGRHLLIKNVEFVKRLDVLRH